MLSQRIGLIGAGQMATAFAQGLVKAGLCAPDRLIASDTSDAARERFAAATDVATTDDNKQVAARSQVLVFAVKPQHMPDAATSVRPALRNDALVVSIAAGVRLATLREWLGSEVRLVRVMPNTPCLIGQGVCGYSLGDRATEDDAALVREMLGALGGAWQLDERLLDAVTALAGSGPAFIYLVIEALSDAGVQAGLPRTVAAEMAARTVRGAADMVLATGEHPAVLKDRVASPGGTTIAGLRVLEIGALRATLMSAVEAAAKRSKELGSA